MSSQRKKRKAGSRDIPDLCIKIKDKVIQKGVKALHHGDPDWSALSFSARVANVFPLSGDDVTAVELDSYSPADFEKKHLLRPPGTQEGTNTSPNGNPSTGWVRSLLWSAKPSPHTHVGAEPGTVRWNKDQV